jgi:hypothetical protein
MPEVCQMFEAMTNAPEGRLAVIQKKQLCQFCFRHPDTQPCPSPSLTACPVRGCMRMHHRMLHRALMREEARPIVLGAVSGPGGHGAEEDPLTSDSEGPPLLTSDESEGEEPERSHLCMQMVPVEANGVMHALPMLYDWGSTVTLVRRESMRKMGFWPAQVAQRLVSGFGGATVPVTGCHFLPLVDAQGKHQVICAYEVEEITTVVEMRLPPWAREVFPSVRAHMPWMDTRAGPIELLIGLDNTQWLPVRLEDSQDQSVNMRLMKSAFGHQFMVMGGWGTALYPSDESMRFRGDPSGGRLSHAEMERKVRLERCIGGRLHVGARDGGRAAIRGPLPSRERAAPEYGPVGSRRPQQAREGVPPPIRMPFNPPQVQVRPAAVGEVGEGPSDPHNHGGSPFPTSEGCLGCCNRRGQWILCNG